MQQLWREIKAQGYPHSDQALRRHLQTLREKKPGDFPQASCLDHFSAKKAMWLFIRRITDLDEKEREELATIRQASETAQTLYLLVQQFLQMVRKLEGERASGLVHLGEGKWDRGTATVRQRLATGQSRSSHGVNALLQQRASRRAGDQDQAHQANDVRSRSISLVASARFAPLLREGSAKQTSLAQRSPSEPIP
jgi:hypothetical protein